MAVTGNEPVSVDDLKLVVDALKVWTLQEIQNQMELTEAKWSGSASTTGSTSMTISEKESSQYIRAVGTTRIEVVNPGTYRITAQAGSGGTYCYVVVSMSVDGSSIQLANLRGSGASSTVDKTFTTTRANASIYFSIDEYDTNANSIRLSNIKIERVS